MKNKSGRVFILGAGFSAGAGIPTCPTLLEHAMDLYKRELPDRYKDLEIVFESGLFGKKPFNFKDIDLADLCTYFDYCNLTEAGMNNQRYIGVGRPEDFRAEIFKSFLAKAIVHRIPKTSALPKMYMQFAKLLTNQDMVCTFNWDCIVEACIHHIGKEYTYSVFPLHDYKDVILVNKLHGSVNWQVGDTLNDKKGWDRSYIDMDENLDVYFNDKEIEPSFWLKNRKGFNPPFMILPGFGKAYDVRVVAPLWANWEFAFMKRKKIYIIGLSLAPDDFFTRQMWKDCLHHLSQAEIVIINPNASVQNAFDFFKEMSNVRYIEDKMSPEIIQAINSGEL
ncbi:MAG TPA: hypothetical protein VHO72_03815 [Bacteroidales bacterium]|nr:hypothetical protein [Bacteroidales bacterium]